MTYEEALTLLNGMEFADKYQGKEEYTNMLILCKQALEKQIPKEPYREYDDEGYIEIEECPTCHTMDIFIFDAEQNYCSNCGQSIKW